MPANLNQCKAPQSIDANSFDSVIRQSAADVVELPADRRESRLASMKRMYFITLLSAGHSVVHALELSKMLDSFVRETVYRLLHGRDLQSNA